MTDQSAWTMLAVVVVAFIAGYSIVSYGVRKFKEGAAQPTSKDQDQQGSEPLDEDT